LLSLAVARAVGYTPLNRGKFERSIGVISTLIGGKSSIGGKLLSSLAEEKTSITLSGSTIVKSD
jgi:hypothetical protein